MACWIILGILTQFFLLIVIVWLSNRSDKNDRRERCGWLEDVDFSDVDLDD